MMRDVTRHEVDAYLRWARGDSAARHFTEDQLYLVGEAVLATDLISSVLSKAAETMPPDAKPQDIFLSIWVSAFQMGREFQSRLET